MAQFIPQESLFPSLKGKVVVISGASTGIGAATTTLLHKSGAHIVLGDTNELSATNLITSLQSSPPQNEQKGELTFLPTNVTSHSSIYTLFRTAYDKYGHIDHAVSCAGIFERGKWFNPELDIDSIEADDGSGGGMTDVMDVNFLGSARFARVAVVFLKHGRGVAGSGSGGEEGEAKGEDKSLTFLSSVNAFRESPGLFMYQSSKHAIHGLMRSMRKPIYETHKIRVNCICPGVTESPMTTGIIDTFKRENLYWQPAEAVAKFILGVQVQRGMNGKAIYIEGGDGWEFEDSFIDAQPMWLGVEGTRRMRVNTEAIQKGALLKK